MIIKVAVRDLQLKLLIYVNNIIIIIRKYRRYYVNTKALLSCN